MISKISSKITDMLIRQSAIENENKELYIYGFFILLSQILYFVVTIIIGIVFNIVIESVIFYVAFQFIRRYAGGSHASTEIRCEMLTTLSIIICLSVIKLSQYYDFKVILLIVSLISSACILCFCPLDTPEKPLSEKEFKYFRKISWLILFIITISMVTSYILDWDFVFTPCCMSLIFESILISVGKAKKYRILKK